MLGWNIRQVYLTISDAKKIRHHPMHGMDAAQGLALPLVIEKGDYYQLSTRGSKSQIEVILHEENPKRAYYLVLAKDRSDLGLFLRTFYRTSELSRSKMSKATVLLRQSEVEYFK